MQREQLEVLFESSLPMLHRCARRMLRNREDSEDALQDAMLLAFRNIARFEGRAQFGTWVHMILLNSVRNMARRKRTRPQATVEIEPGEGGLHPRFTEWLTAKQADPESQYLEGEAQALLHKLLQQLPPRSRRMLEMYELEGLGVQEIAARMRVRPGTVKSQMHRARRFLVARRNSPAGDNRVGSRKRTRPSGDGILTVKSWPRREPASPRTAHRATRAA